MDERGSRFQQRRVPKYTIFMNLNVLSQRKGVLTFHGSLGKWATNAKKSKLSYPEKGTSTFVRLRRK